MGLTLLWYIVHNNIPPTGIFMLLMSSPISRTKYCPALLIMRFLTLWKKNLRTRQWPNKEWNAQANIGLVILIIFFFKTSLNMQKGKYLYHEDKAMLLIIYDILGHARTRGLLWLNKICTYNYPVNEMIDVSSTRTGGHHTRLFCSGGNIIIVSMRYQFGCG